MAHVVEVPEIHDRDVAIVDLGDLDHVSNCEVVIQRVPNPQDDQQETGA